MTSDVRKPGERKAYAAPKETKANINRAMDEFLRGFEGLFSCPGYADHDQFGMLIDQFG